MSRGASIDTGFTTASPIVAPAPAWSGGIDLGYGFSGRTSTDTSIENSPFGGFSVGDYFSTSLGQMDLTIDGPFKAAGWMEPLD